MTSTPTSEWTTGTAPTRSSGTATGCSGPTSSTTGATRRWGAPGPTSTSPRSAVRKWGRTHPRATPRLRPTSGGTTTTRTGRPDDHAGGRRSQVGGARVARLVEADVATAGQPEPGEPPPALLGEVLGELHALGAQLLHRGLHVVAREEELVRGGTLRGVHRHLRRGQLEDQPPAAGVHVRLSQDVGEEGPVRLGFTAEQHDMASVDHATTVRREAG